MAHVTRYGILGAVYLLCSNVHNIVVKFVTIKDKNVEEYSNNMVMIFLSLS